MMAISKRTRKCMYTKPFVLERVTKKDSKLLVYDVYDISRIRERAVLGALFWLFFIV